MSFMLRSPAEQVAAHLREQIARGRWTAAFPGTPALSAEMGVDRKTIRAAIGLLEEEGQLKFQGAGRPRLVTRARKASKKQLQIQLLPHEDDDRQRAHVMQLVPRVQRLGHELEIDRRSLMSMGMNEKQIKRHVCSRMADAWIVIAAPRNILSWFADEGVPVMALFGRRRQVPISSVGPDKIAAMRDCVQRLVSLGHQRIVLMAREERRIPTPGALEQAFLEELQTQGITPGSFHLPDWNDQPSSFHDCLDGLFAHTPPTALILDEAQFYVAALQHLAQRKLVVPEDVSLVSSDTHPLLSWCLPSVTHIHWEPEPVVDHIVEWVRQLAEGRDARQVAYREAHFVEGGSIGPAPQST